MILKFFKILKNLKYLKKEILKTKFIIFDSTSIELLKIHLLRNLDYYIIDNRYEKLKLYYSLNLILGFIKKYFKYFYNKELLVQDIYFLTLIELINPKLVLSVHELNTQFSKLSKYANRKIKFMTLQLYTMPQRNMMTYLHNKGYLKENLIQNYYYPIYLGFGKFQKVDFIKNKVNVKNFVSVGSINLANFLKNYKNKKRKKYEI